jgi:hypothetical protein
MKPCVQILVGVKGRGDARSSKPTRNAEYEGRQRSRKEGPRVSRRECKLQDCQKVTTALPRV